MNINRIQNSPSINKQTIQRPNSAKATSFEEILNSNMNSHTNFDKIFEDASQKHGIPTELLKAVAKVESNYNPEAVSSSGASGVMQLMPATARGLGVTDVFNAEQNINGGAKYLSQLYKKYNGDLNLTLAGYNAGPGNVAKYGGVPPFKETENYIIKVGKALKEDGLVGEVAPKIQNISMVQDNILDSKEISYWLESLKYQFFKELNDKNFEYINPLE